MSRLAWFAAAVLALAVSVPGTSRAGLRAQYGGELVVVAATEPHTMDPALAWSPVEVVIARALGGDWRALLDGPPRVEESGSRVRLVLRAGTGTDARGVVQSLRKSVERASVALPPFSFEAEANSVIATLPHPLPFAADLLMLPWVAPEDSAALGGFRVRRGAFEARANSPGGRSLVDGLRIETKSVKRGEVPASAIRLDGAKSDGRPVFVWARPKGQADASLAAALGKLDRAQLTRRFVSAPSRVPADWPMPRAREGGAASGEPLVIAVDSSERDLPLVAERLQLILRDIGTTARVLSEPRGKHSQRLRTGAYDIAISALPTAPEVVQAATLARLVAGSDAAAAVWKRAGEATPPRDPLREVAQKHGAALLYVEGGAVVAGTRVRGPLERPIWELDPGSLWIMPALGAQ